MEHVTKPLNVSRDALDDVYGNGLKELPTDCVEKGRAFNSIAMKYIKEDSGSSDFSIAFDYLKKAESLLQNDAHGKLLTYQNMAFLYQKVGYPRLSLRYLKRAGVILNELEGNIDKRVDCHLNVCATMSRLGNHKTALSHAKIAIAMIKDELCKDTTVTDTPEKSSLKSVATESPKEEAMKDDPNETERRKSVPQLEPILENRFVSTQLREMLAIAYYNAGAECEHLRNLDASVKFYQQGKKVTSKLKKDHVIRKALEDVVDEDTPRIKDTKVEEKRKGTKHSTSPSKI